MRAPLRAFLLLVLLIHACPLAAQEAASDDAPSKQRMLLMEQTIAGFEIKSDAMLPKPALSFAAKPLLRYSDPTRGLTDANVLLDASVWRLGTSGRPTALVTLELYRATGNDGVLSYEFASLSAARFALRHTEREGVAWSATGSALTMQPLDEAPRPAKTAGGRLTQMRQLARQFSVRERLLNGDVVECRLLAQPIDRYSAPDDKLLDGAIFAFANGTNPELGLLLECDGERWSYGAVRLSAAETTLHHVDRQVAHFVTGDFRGVSGTYSSANHRLELPE